MCSKKCSRRNREKEIHRNTKKYREMQRNTEKYKER